MYNAGSSQPQSQDAPAHTTTRLVPTLRGFPFGLLGLGFLVFIARLSLQLRSLCVDAPVRAAQY